MYGTSGLVVAIAAFAATYLIDQITSALDHRQVPLFYQTVVGGAIGPLVAALMLDVWAWHWVVLGIAGLFVLADVAMRVWQRSSTVVPAVFEQHRDIWVQPLRIAFGHIGNLAGLKRLIALTMGVNLIIGVTLATSAAMVTGLYVAGKDAYALLQAAGALVTIVILFYLARATLPLKLLGGLSYAMIALGALIMAISPTLWLYSLGFLLVIGFDKMYSVYMRSVRQQVIPVQDFGKTVGVITLLNNLPQPLAGLVIAVLAAPLGVQTVILLLAGITALIGVAVASGWYATVKAELDVG